MPAAKMDHNWTAVLFTLVCVVVAVCCDQLNENDGTNPVEYIHEHRFTFLIVSTGAAGYHHQRTRALVNELERQRTVWKLRHKPQVLTVTDDFHDQTGAWAIYPILNSLVTKTNTYHGADNDFWLMVLKEDTVIRLDLLLDAIGTKQANSDVFLGRALVDEHSAIIHHFAPSLADAQHRDDTRNLKDPGDGVLRFPSLAAGYVLSSHLLRKVAASGLKVDFTIDAKYELAKHILETSGTRLEHSDAFCCCPPFGYDCATEYQPWSRAPDSGNIKCMNKVTNDDIVFAVKTYHEYHKTRVVVCKRTWAKYAATIEFFSDEQDPFIPSVALDVNNTESGHCAKTFAIMKHFLDLLEYKYKKWLIIADDDTLLSVSRLISMLRCYNSGAAMIIGERYGYGFNDGHGYDYPTGGSGMIFSRSAVERMVERCSCPSDNSPDDMIIGMCAKQLKIPVHHSEAMHQARPEEYARDYLAQEQAVSFHKHWQVDPYQVYDEYLKDPDDSLHAAHHVAHDADETFVKQHVDDEHQPQTHTNTDEHGGEL